MNQYAPGKLSHFELYMGFIQTYTGVDDSGTRNKTKGRWSVSATSAYTGGGALVFEL